MRAGKTRACKKDSTSRWNSISQVEPRKGMGSGGKKINGGSGAKERNWSRCFFEVKEGKGTSEVKTRMWKEVSKAGANSQGSKTIRQSRSP